MATAQHVHRGGEVSAVVSFYHPQTRVLTRPDQHPAGVVFVVKDAGGEVVQGYERVPYAQHLATGEYLVRLRIPYSASGLANGQYSLEPHESVTVGGLVPSDVNGAPISIPFVVEEEPTSRLAPYDSSLYATPDELEQSFGVSPQPTEAEIARAQALIDDYMRRSIWPTLHLREKHYIPEDRTTLILHHTPVLQILDVQTSTNPNQTPVRGRYGYPRRDNRVLYGASWDLRYTISALGFGPPQWLPIDPASVEVEAETGFVWLPATLYTAPYTEVQISYEAGYRVVPAAVKWALAETIEYVRFKGFGSVSSHTFGRISASTQGQSLITPDVERRLRPYKVRVYG